MVEKQFVRAISKSGGIVPTFFLLSFFLISCSASRPNLGHDQGRLKPCPDKKNCVNSQAEKESDHYIEPIKIISNLDHAQKKILGILVKNSNAKVVKVSMNYIHAEFRSSLFKFVDDVEFYFNENDMLIHMRSSSRVGAYDFKANRKRIESIRFKYHQNDF